jgi:hypothetical protein
MIYIIIQITYLKRITICSFFGLGGTLKLVFLIQSQSLFNP